MESSSKELMPNVEPHHEGITINLQALSGKLLQFDAKSLKSYRAKAAGYKLICEKKARKAELKPKYLIVNYQYYLLHRNSHKDAAHDYNFYVLLIADYWAALKNGSVAYLLNPQQDELEFLDFEGLLNKNVCRQLGGRFLEEYEQNPSTYQLVFQQANDFFAVNYQYYINARLAASLAGFYVMPAQDYLVEVNLKNINYKSLEKESLNEVIFKDSKTFFVKYGVSSLSQAKLQLYVKRPADYQLILCEKGRFFIVNHSYFLVNQSKFYYCMAATIYAKAKREFDCIYPQKHSIKILGFDKRRDCFKRLSEKTEKIVGKSYREISGDLRVILKTDEGLFLVNYKFYLDNSKKYHKKSWYYIDKNDFKELIYCGKIFYVFQSNNEFFLLQEKLERMGLVLEGSRAAMASLAKANLDKVVSVIAGVHKSLPPDFGFASCILPGDELPLWYAVRKKNLDMVKALTQYEDFQRSFDVSAAAQFSANKLTIDKLASESEVLFIRAVASRSIENLVKYLFVIFENIFVNFEVFDDFINNSKSAFELLSQAVNDPNFTITQSSVISKLIVIYLGEYASDPYSEHFKELGAICYRFKMKNLFDNNSLFDLAVSVKNDAFVIMSLFGYFSEVVDLAALKIILQEFSTSTGVWPIFIGKASYAKKTVIRRFLFSLANLLYTKPEMIIKDVYSFIDIFKSFVTNLGLAEIDVQAIELAYLMIALNKDRHMKFTKGLFNIATPINKLWLQLEKNDFVLTVADKLRLRIELALDNKDLSGLIWWVKQSFSSTNLAFIWEACLKSESFYKEFLGILNENYVSFLARLKRVLERLFGWIVEYLLLNDKASFYEINPFLRTCTELMKHFCIISVASRSALGSEFNLYPTNAVREKVITNIPIEILPDSTAAAGISQTISDFRRSTLIEMNGKDYSFSIFNVETDRNRAFMQKHFSRTLSAVAGNEIIGQWLGLYCNQKYVGGFDALYLIKLFDFIFNDGINDKNTVTQESEISYSLSRDKSGTKFTIIVRQGLKLAFSESGPDIGLVLPLCTYESTYVVSSDEKKTKISSVEFQGIRIIFSKGAADQIVNTWHTTLVTRFEKLMSKFLWLPLFPEDYREIPVLTALPGVLENLERIRLREQSKQPAPPVPPPKAGSPIKILRPRSPVKAFKSLNESVANDSKGEALSVSKDLNKLFSKQGPTSVVASAPTRGENAEDETLASSFDGSRRGSGF